jgi:uncharacterized protein (AIM24 family)
MQAEIKGTTMPILEVSLDQGEQVVSTRGELAWMTQGVQMAQKMSTAGGGGMMRGFKRALGGAGLIITHYDGPGMVTFAAKVPGHIVPVDIAPGQAYYVHKHGWLCGTPEIVPSVGLQRSFRGGLWGGEGFVLEKLEGQGRAWIELSGELTTYDLQPGQTLLVHPGHVGMFQGSIQYDITHIKGVKNVLFGADGYHLVSMSGPGRVWLQSMPLPVLAFALSPFLPQQGNDASNAGSGLAGAVIGGMLKS